MKVNKLYESKDFPHEEFPTSVNIFITKKIIIIKENGKLSKKWIIEDHSMNFILVMDDFLFINNQLNITFFNFLIFCLQKYKPQTVKQNFYKVKSVLRKLFETKLKYNQESFFALSFESSASRYAGEIIRFFKFCDNMDILDVSDSLRTEISSYSNLFKRYTVAFNNVTKGPLTDLELQLVVEKLKYDDGPCYQRCILWLCILFGLRPSQLILLKEIDFRKASNSKHYFLYVPSVKKRKNFRDRLVPRLIESKNLIAVILEVLHRNKSITNVSETDRPLFFRGTWGNSRPNSEILKDPSLEYHINAYEFYFQFKQIVKRLGVISPRTNELLNLTAYRFRYTLATQSILDGHSIEEVAEILDHKSVESLHYYFKITEEYYKYLDSSIANNQEFEQFRSFWNGTLIKRSEHEFSKNEILLESKITGIGLCGKNGDCSYLPAFNCYSCSFFQPFDDDIHVQARQDMLQIQKRISESSSGAVKSQANLALKCNKNIIDAVNQTKNE